MPRIDPPEDIVALADERSAARRARDFETADRLKAAIEAAGWRVVDAASLYTLEPATPPDLEVDGEVRYGSSASVPSRLEEAPVGTATVVVVAEDDAEAVGRTLAALVEHAPDGTQVVVVANAPSDAQAAALGALDAADPGAPGVVTEVVRTATRLGCAAALNAGIRRAAAPVVVVVEAGLVPDGDLVGPVVAALDDERVAVAGPVALVTDDLRSFTVAAGDDAREPDAIAGLAIGFRRSDYVDRGPLDERFTVPAWLDAWWSLVLRDLGEDDDLETGPRRAAQTADVGVGESAQPPTVADAPADRATKKAFYRFLKDFAARRDLLAGPEGDAVRARLRGSL
jgi:hypothetical protein